MNAADSDATIQAGFKGTNVLLINSSSQIQDSVTRLLTSNFLQEMRDQFRDQHSQITVTKRDVAQLPLPIISEAWVQANFTNPEQRSAAHQETLSLSDTLVEELQAADVILIGVPIYNFGIPASLKTWIDLIARVGQTFRYTENGPVGLLKDKQAFVIIASGGVPIGSEMDYASQYLRHVLGFIGISDVKIIPAERLNSNSEASMQQAQQKITETIAEYEFHTSQVA